MVITEGLWSDHSMRIRPEGGLYHSDICYICADFNPPFCIFQKIRGVNSVFVISFPLLVGFLPSKNHKKAEFNAGFNGSIFGDRHGTYGGQIGA